MLIQSIKFMIYAVLHHSNASAMGFYRVGIDESRRCFYSHIETSRAAALTDTHLTIPGLAGRYAIALFELARDSKTTESVEASCETLCTALETSIDLKNLTKNPLISRSNASKAMTAVAKALDLDPLTTKFLAVLGQNRRLAALPAILSGFTQLTAHHRGEITAEVTSAHALNDGQIAALKAKLKSRMGKDVNLVAHVDASLLGGLVVKLGSKRIDSSLKTKLDQLSLVMKG